MLVTSFSRNSSNGVTLWVGNPDCQAAHNLILTWLKGRISSFRTNASTSDNILKGNLGEAISFCVGLWNHFGNYYPFPANAFNPLDTIARDGIDIVWILFGSTEDNDIAV